MEPAGPAYESADEAPAEVDYVRLFRDYNGLPIKTIAFQGTKDVEEDLLCNTLTIGEGDPFNAEQVEQSRLELLELDKFSSAGIEVAEQDDGLIVNFVLREKWHVMSVPLLPPKQRKRGSLPIKTFQAQTHRVRRLTY